MEPAGEVAPVDPVTVTAPRIRWEDGTAIAEGGVEVRWDDQRLFAARATWTGDRLRLEDGEWRRPDGTLRFARAEVVGRTVVVDDAVLEGEARLGAERVTVEETGPWAADRASLWPCACADGGAPALTLGAREAEVEPGEVVVARGVTVRLFGVPVGWVPRVRVAMAPERFRVGVPELGWGDEGVAVAWSGGATIDGWRVDGGPALLSGRGVRARARVDGPWADGRGEVGWDWETESWRGALRSVGGRHDRVRLGWDVDAQSDPDYADDYDVDYVTRGVAWRVSRGTVGWGPERFSVDLPDDGGADARVVQRLRYEVGGPVAVAPRTELGWVGSTATGTGNGVALGGVDARFRHTLGPVSVGLGGDGGGWLGTAGEAGAFARGEAEATLAIWGEVGRKRVQGWLGGRASGDAWTGSRVYGDGLGLRTVDPPPPWAAGPVGRAETGLGGTVVAAEAWGRWTEAGFEPVGQARVSGGPVTLEARAEAARQWGRVRVDLGGVDLGGGVLHDGGLALGWGDAGLGWRRARGGGSLAWDLGAGSWSGAGARLGYDDGCVAVGVSAAFSPDRALPDLGVKVELRR